MPLLELELPVEPLEAESVAAATLEDVLEERPPVAAKIPIEEESVVGEEVIADGMPVDFDVWRVVFADDEAELAEVAWSTAAAVVLVVASLELAVAVGSGVSIATPNVVYPATAPVKVGDWVT